jgi:hypothetical protein
MPIQKGFILYILPILHYEKDKIIEMENRSVSVRREGREYGVASGWVGVTLSSIGMILVEIKLLQISIVLRSLFQQ